MTSWKPDFAPYLEIQYDCNLNGSGYKEGVATVFNKVLSVLPNFQNGSGQPPAPNGHLSANWSGGAYDIYHNDSGTIIAQSCGYSAVIHGIR